MKNICFFVFVFFFCVFITSLSDAKKNNHANTIKKNTRIGNKIISSVKSVNNEKVFETITKTFPLNYIEPEIIAQKLTVSFSSITVITDLDTNSLIVTAESNRFVDIANFIAISDLKTETINVKISLLELNESCSLSDNTNTNATVILNKEELFNISKWNINGDAIKIFDSGNFILHYNSTTTINFKTNYSDKQSGSLEISINPVILSTQSAQIITVVTLNAYSLDISTTSKVESVVKYLRHSQNSILLKDVIERKIRELCYMYPFMSTINEVGQLFDKERVLSNKSKILLLIQLQETNNE